jgi:AGCS family alanine or glycine:cation symporter
MAAFYVIGCLIILAFSWDKLGATFSLIITSAFNGHAAVGGFAGAGIAAVMRAGIARGLFSNESGLGSAPIVAAAAQTKDPVRQALVSSTGTFWDTVVICALTGLVVVSSGDWSGDGMTKASLCSSAFHHLGFFGDLILLGGLLTFVFSTILGWSYYGEKAVEYLLGIRAVLPYRWLWVAAVFIGAVWKSGAVWDFSDMMNGLMAVPNIISLFLLSHVIAAETKRYFAENKS